jgi:hypothetical protein
VNKTAIIWATLQFFYKFSFLCVFELCSSSCKIHKVNLFSISHLFALSGYVARYKARRTHTQRNRDFKSLLGILIIWTNWMHCLLLIYFNNSPLHVSSRLAAHHQEDQLCINSNWYSQHNAWIYQLLFVQSWSSWW